MIRLVNWSSVDGCAIATQRTCLDLRATSTDMRGSAEGIGESRALTRIAQRQADWAQKLPKEPDQLWDWLLTQESVTLMGLIAVASACTVNAVQKPHERADHARLNHAGRLAAAVGLDMAQWWQPTGPAYLARVPKKLILEAVAEAVSLEAADNLSGLKKDVLIANAGERLAGTGWLPTILRAPAASQGVDALAAE
jgi:ParB family chromosome partitioning protein